MGAELFDARPELLDRSDDVLGWSLREVCLGGPIELLTRTDRAQPALFALSFVLFDELMSHLDDAPSAAAGHSLGEYTAFAAAGVFEFEEALRLVAARGAAMAEAAGREASSMAALLGADDELAESIAANRRADGGRLWVANYNAPGQVVLAGAAADIEWVVESARELGVRRAVPLNVAGAFHSPLMEPAKAQLSDALAHTEPRPAQFPVWANATSAPAGADVRTLLLDQLVSPVRFAGSLAGMASEGHDTFVHVGPGDVTAGMAKRAARQARVLVVNDLESARSVAGELGP